MSRPAEESDPRRLRQRLAAGDAAALADVFDRYGLRLYRAAARLLGCRDEAEDAVQELFVSLVRSRERLNGVENLSAYLFVSLRRQVARAIERRRQRPRSFEGVFDPPANSRSDFVAAESREQLDAALDCLPFEQREVVAMKIDGELTFAEIAEVLEISPNTAASRYRYALDKLRDLLAEEAPVSEPRGKSSNREKLP